MLWLISQRTLLPGVVLIGTFILLVLWLTGLIETAILMFGNGSGVNSNCSSYVTDMPYSGVSVGTLAWLEQKMICK